MSGLDPDPPPRRRLPARPAVLGLLALALLTLAPALPAAAERTQSDLVLIREDDVVSEDLYAAGNVIRIAGRVEGDLLAAAFDEIRIDGEVTGSVTGVASRVVVNGTVGGSLRVSARQVTVAGDVGDDVLAAGWSVATEPEARIGRDLLVWARHARLGGRVGRDVEGQQTGTRLAAQVDGGVEVTVGRLTVTETARVDGSLTYISERPADIADGAEVGGTVVHRTPLPPNIRIRALWLLGEVLAVLGATLLGLLTLWAVPARAAAATRAVRHRPLLALGWGLTVVAVPVVLALVTGLVVGLSPPAAGIPLLVILGPLVVGLASMVAVAALFAPVPVASAVGGLMVPGRSPWAWFVVGMAGVAVLTLVPWLGALVVAALVVVGLGGWVLSGDDDGADLGSSQQSPVETQEAP